MMRFKRTISVLLMLALLLSGCQPIAAPVEIAPLEETKLDPAMVAEIDAYVEEMMDATGLPGFALGIVRDGELAYARGFGVANLETGEPVTPQTVFQLAEATMAPTTLAMLQLAEAGKIDLDAPITEYLPYFKMAGEGSGDITVRQLLLNTSGVPDSGDTATDWTEMTPELDDEAVERLVRSLADTELLFAPGEGFEWSDIGYHILGDVVAKVTGQPYETYMRENLLTPLGMEHSTFLLDEVDPALLASPHIEDDDGAALLSDVFPYSRQFASANNFYSNVEDMARFAQANLNRGELDGTRILPEPYFDEMWTAYNEPSFGDFVLGNIYPAAVFAEDGLGWFIFDQAGNPMVHAYGGERGYQADVMLSPDHGLAVITMGNGIGGGAGYTIGVATDVMGMLLDDMAEAPAKTGRLEPEQLSTIEAAAEAVSIVVSSEEGQLNLWGTSGEDIFTVGHHGAIMHFDGQTWSSMKSPIEYSAEWFWLLGVWGTAGDSVYAVGDIGTIVHYDGSEWSYMRSGVSNNLWSVWGSSDEDVFAVGTEGGITHFDGTVWAPMESGTNKWLLDTWGFAPDNVYAVGESGTILHYDGSAWSTVESGTDNDLYTIWGSSATDIFVAGDHGTVLHFDGATWMPMSSGTLSWLQGSWGDAPDNVFLVGDGGTLLHYDGSTWSSIDSGTGWLLFNVWGDPEGMVYALEPTDAFTSATIHQFASAELPPAPSLERTTLFGVAGSGADSVMAVGERGTILRYDGTAWSPMASGATQSLFAVWGDSADSFVTVGQEGTILQYLDGAWHSMESGTQQDLTGVAGTASTDIFAVGRYGTILHYNGQVWQPMESGTLSDVFAVWAAAPNDVFAGCADGTILHYDGDAWTDMGNLQQRPLYAVWGSSGEDVYAVGYASGPIGQQAVIQHFDGVKWSPQYSNIYDVLYGIWGSSASDVYSVGGFGNLLHNSSGRRFWLPIETGSEAVLRTVWGSAADDVFAVGSGGTILHFDGESWTPMPKSTQ